MSTVNKKKVETIQERTMRKEAHPNFMGGPSYDVKNPILRLICVSASSFFGEPAYYKSDNPKSKKRTSSYPHRSITLTGGELKTLRSTLHAIGDTDWQKLSMVETMEKTITEALAYDPEETLRWAVALRNDEMIRVTPQVILVLAANTPALKGTGLIRKYAKEILKRGDEPATQLAYQLSKFGNGPIPNSLKKAWGDFLNSASEYSLAKYRMESREVKTVDVARLAFGNGCYGFQNPIGKLVRGELKLGDDIQTWESIRSSGGSWQKAVEVMGHMALLRNIRNFINEKVDVKLWLPKLVATAKKGMQLPFRYYTAYNEVKKVKASGPVLDALEECLAISLDNLPRLPGKSLILADNSGSTQSTPVSEMSSARVCDIGNLMAVITGMVSDDGTAGVFGDRLKLMSIQKRASVFSQAAELRKFGHTIGQGTEHGIWLALDKMIRNKEHYDNLFIYSDMQAGHGGLYGTGVPKEYIWKRGAHGGGVPYVDVPKLLNVYRNHVNPDINVFLVQIAGYEDTLLPEYYHRTFIIGGWSGSIIRFARCMIDAMNRYSKK